MTRKDPYLFANRHCGLSEADEREMLASLGMHDLEDITKILPPVVVANSIPDIGPALTESEATDAVRAFADKNQLVKNMIGLGYYDTEMPAVIRRNMLESPAWYTAYTPYQSEISQGRLEMLLNFQTMVCDLTGLPLAGASLLDEATAAAEAMTMIARVNKKAPPRFLVDSTLFPQTLSVLKTRAEPLGIELVVASPAEFAEQGEAFGALIGYPNGEGAVADWTDLIDTLKKKNINVACCTDLLALACIKSCAEMGFEIAVGNSQRFGVPVGYGGPHAGFMAFTERYKRQAPGRVVGVSKDSKGRVGYRLAVQAREQHIRREKATSNICTAQALPAMLAAAYAVYHGPERLQSIAVHVHNQTSKLASALSSMGREPSHKVFFDTLTVAATDAQEIVGRARKEGVNLREGDGEVGISVDERTKPHHIEVVLRAFAGDSKPAALRDESTSIPDTLRRRSPFWEHAVFNSHHTEHEMLRYLQELAEKDIALNRSMIPLGSCTMKLNATTEMEPLSWPKFGDIHPFAPKEQASGYKEMADDLADLLAKLSGFSAVSLQPNAGAQGEYAGLLVIRAYLRSIGEEKRNVCLIPRSAHGTNPASAAMAGLKVVPVEIDEAGQVAVDDLRNKIEEHRDSLAALMITYPSTCGVFGSGIKKICDLVHEVGGQVYMDGANFNALAGLSLPRELGADVMHFNLHKTFCIPHGGGGPGMGPIGVAEHLRDLLPGHPLSEKMGIGTVSAAPLGSALILLIPWIYIRMMGLAGLRRATLTALLSANYLARRLAEKFQLEFRDADGFVAHECIVDAQGFKDAGVSAEDIAKRLMDFGFHAPTVSWPVPGAIMIEPTESEPKAEIDRFCEALLAIEGEITRIRNGEWPKDDNPLVNAPHVAEDVVSDHWNHPYTREQAAFPQRWVRKRKYWPPIGRIDAAWGDRNLVCTCPPIDSYTD